MYSVRVLPFGGGKQFVCVSEGQFVCVSEGRLGMESAEGQFVCVSEGRLGM